MREPCSPRATPFRQRPEGDISGALRVVDQPANGRGDIHLVTLSECLTAWQRDLNFKLCSVVPLLWRRAKTAERLMESAAGPL